MSASLQRRSAPLAARRFCLECQGASSVAVRLCADESCPLFDWRLPECSKAGEPLGQSPKWRLLLRAIRRQCLACAGKPCEVRVCAARETCALWSYRFGVRPRTYIEVRRRFFAPRELDLPLTLTSGRAG